MSATATSLSSSQRSWSQRHTRIAIELLALVGFVGILAWVIRSQNVGDIVGDFRALGAAIGWVIALHVVVIVCDGTAWRVLLRQAPGVSLIDFVWARWVREATNMLLPVAQVGGEVVGARILALRGLPAERAGGSVVLDKFAEALSQIPFTLIGLLLMLALRGETEITESVALALFVVVAGMAAVLLARHTPWFRGAAGRVTTWINRGPQTLLRQIEPFVQAVRAIYRPERFGAAIAWHLAAWIIGAGEVWLALMFMGHPISFVSALILESLGQAIIGLGFVVPAALGVQEGAYMAIGAALGLPPETALALSLVKRARQLVLGVPALCSWQALELRQLIGAAIGGQPAIATTKVPSSNSNSYVRRFVRAALQPFAATALTPNGVTWLRIATGFAACAACCVGVPVCNHAAALLWLLSALLDRGDGEFARMTRRCTEQGRVLDYWGDVAINALIFFAIGINLRHHALGEWAVLIGAVAALAIGIAGVLAEALELRLGHKTVPSRHGFDFDDILFVLVPILWLGYLMPLLIGAFVGGVGAATYIWYRLSHFSAPSPAGSRMLS
jgi:putative membrane protein